MLQLPGHSYSPAEWGKLQVMAALSSGRDHFYLNLFLGPDAKQPVDKGKDKGEPERRPKAGNRETGHEPTREHD